MPYAYARRLLASAIIAALGIGLSLPRSAVADSTPPPVLPDAETASLYSSSNRVLMMLRLGDAPPLPVVFDTGTTSNALDTKSVAKLDLKRIGINSVFDGTLGKSFDAPTVALSPATLGGIDLRAATADVYDYDEQDAAGIFGPNSFSGRLVYLEFDKGRIRLRKKDASTIPRGPAIPYVGTVGDMLPAIQVSLPGMTVKGILDSGNTTDLILPLGLAKKLPLVAPPIVVSKAKSVSGVQDVYGAQIKGIVRIGPLTLVNPRVKFIGFGDNANVGIPLMRQMTIVLDPAGLRNWVLQPARLSPAQLRAYAGRYDVRAIRAGKVGLIYQRDGREPFAMTFLGEDLFEIPATGDRLQFRRDGGGKVIGFDFVGSGGSVAAVDRTV